MQHVLLASPLLLSQCYVGSKHPAWHIRCCLGPVAWLPAAVHTHHHSHLQLCGCSGRLTNITMHTPQWAMALLHDEPFPAALFPHAL
jgi:hypothetical protein